MNNQTKPSDRILASITRRGGSKDDAINAIIDYLDEEWDMGKKEKSEFIKLDKKLFKDPAFQFKLEVPTFICECGEEVLDTPFNRFYSEYYKIHNHNEHTN